jgi:hypothetical protein
MFFDCLDFPDTTVFMDLLSPIPFRNPSPRRLHPKSKSPARWKLLKSVNDAIQDVLNSQANGVYGEFNFLSSNSSHLLPTVQTPKVSRPGRFVHHLDLTHIFKPHNIPPTDFQPYPTKLQLFIAILKSYCVLGPVY